MRQRCPKTDDIRELGAKLLRIAGSPRAGDPAIYLYEAAFGFAAVIGRVVEREDDARLACSRVEEALMHATKNLENHESEL